MAGSRFARWIGVLAAIGTGAVALAAYWTTLLTGVGLWDTAEAQTVPVLAGTMHPTGFPAYVVVGWLASQVLAPLGEAAYRMNLLSAILAAVAAGTTVAIVRRLEVSTPIAVAAGLGLALTPITWRISAAADVHALHLALLALLVLALVRWERIVAAGDGTGTRSDRGLVLAAVVFGVALGNHALTLLLVPAIGAYVWVVDRAVLRRRRTVVAALGTAAGVAALLYLQLPFSAGVLGAPLVYGHPETLSGFLGVIFARQFQGDFAATLASLADAVPALGRLAVAQLGPLAILVLPAFAVTAIRRPAYAVLSGLAAGVTCAFAAVYVNADIGRYYLGPALFAWTWLTILAGAVVDLAAARVAAAAPGRAASRVAPAALALALGGLLLLPTWRALPDTRRAVDRSEDVEMAHWLDDAMTGLDRDALVVSWWSYSTPLWYGTLVEGRRTDLRIVDDSTIAAEGPGSVEDVIDANLGRRPVLVIRLPADLAMLANRYVIEPVDRPGGVYRVTGLREPTP